MPLVLNDEQTMLRDNARGFLGKNAPIAHLRQLRDSRDADGFSRALWKEFVEMGWAGILVPQDHGGLGLGHVEAGMVMEELGRTLTPSPFLVDRRPRGDRDRARRQRKAEERIPAANRARRFDRARSRSTKPPSIGPRKPRCAATRVGQRLHPEWRQDFRPRWPRRRIFSSSPRELPARRARPKG